MSKKRSQQFARGNSRKTISLRCSDCGRDEDVPRKGLYRSARLRCSRCGGPLNFKQFVDRKPVSDPVPVTSTKPKTNPTKKKKQRKRKRTLTAPDYATYMQSKEWRRKRRIALKYHGGKCCVCGTTNNLQVHHTSYVRLGREKMKDLEILCSSCHGVEHEDKYDSQDELSVQFRATVT